MCKIPVLKNENYPPGNQQYCLVDNPSGEKLEDE
jgi:hypothetical protein